MSSTDKTEPLGLKALLSDMQAASQLIQQLGGVAKTATGSVYLLMCVAAYPIEMILRWRHGERVLGAHVMMTAALLTAIANGLIHRHGVDGLWRALLSWDQAYTWVFVGFMMVHRLMSDQRIRTGEKWHSRCKGVSYAFWYRIPRLTLDEDRVQATLEPALAIAVGLLWMQALGPQSTGTLIAIGGACLYLKECILRTKAREALLDACDNKLSAEALGEAMRGTEPASRTAGFVVPGAARWTSAQRRSLVDAYDGLSPELKRSIAQSDDPA